MNPALFWAQGPQLDAKDDHNIVIVLLSRLVFPMEVTTMDYKVLFV